MVEFKIYHKEIGTVHQPYMKINEKSLKEAENDIIQYLNNGWKLMNSSFEGVTYFASLLKE